MITSLTNLQLLLCQVPNVQLCTGQVNLVFFGFSG